MSIPTFDFEECLAKYRWDAVQVIFLLLIIDRFFSLLYVFSHCLCFSCFRSDFVPTISRHPCIISSFLKSCTSMTKIIVRVFDSQDCR